MPTEKAKRAVIEFLSRGQPENLDEALAYAFDEFAARYREPIEAWCEAKKANTGIIPAEFALFESLKESLGYNPQIVDADLDRYTMDERKKILEARGYEFFLSDNRNPAWRYKNKEIISSGGVIDAIQSAWDYMNSK